MALTVGKKRIIVCCDGTWSSSDSGNAKIRKTPGKKALATLQLPSNVTRISRAFSRTCSDGTFQIIYYQSGVGSGRGLWEKIAGGALGISVAENIQEAYAYICANYVDGDDIVLIGFSRGAFTARSIAGMISDLGLLTRDGMEFFLPVFKDMQHWMDYDYEDQFPNVPFLNKPKGVHAAATYTQKLIENNFTRTHQNKGAGDPIRVKAIGVWDTVGSLGIPQITILTPLGINRSTHEFTWYNTSLNPKIEHAFHALALDDVRGPFSPAIWERLPGQTTDLRQVWFPGDHSNIGGGRADQGVADITLAWMMDQLASVGVEFIPKVLDQLCQRNFDYYESLDLIPEGALCQPCQTCSYCIDCASIDMPPQYWALEPIYTSNDPIRPWSLHKIKAAKNIFYRLLGDKARSPGMYQKIDPKSGRATGAFLEDTNERVHSSVRFRLACQGLSVNDISVWECRPLTNLWRLCQVTAEFPDPISEKASWVVQDEPSKESAPTSSKATTVSVAPSQNRWVWEYIGPEKGAPPAKIIVEDNMGPFEKYLQNISCGDGPSVIEMAEKEDFKKFKYPEKRSIFRGRK